MWQTERLSTIAWRRRLWARHRDADSPPSAADVSAASGVLSKAADKCQQVGRGDVNKALGVLQLICEREPKSSLRKLVDVLDAFVRRAEPWACDGASRVSALKLKARLETLAREPRFPARAAEPATLEKMRRRPSPRPGRKRVPEVAAFRARDRRKPPHAFPPAGGPPSRRRLRRKFGSPEASAKPLKSSSPRSHFPRDRGRPPLPSLLPAPAADPRASARR
ncbi:hypothetical protein SO694_0007818 [Aureococcus anophagefferens]|uniref:Uncharacterized protein n=1 Tax=Aureococcus anophagefferens TaxID=44056 RepID=A0ABR1FH51_AURAN